MLILETPRLLLRHLTLDDLPAVATLYSDPIVMAPKGGIRSPELTEQIVKGYLQEYTTLFESYLCSDYSVDQRPRRLPSLSRNCAL
jgi:RimJ/RimL family protein N-acetyltransferase